MVRIIIKIIIMITNRIVIRIINRIEFVKIISSSSTAVMSKIIIGIIYDVLEEVMSKHLILRKIPRFSYSFTPLMTC